MRGRPRQSKSAEAAGAAENRGPEAVGASEGEARAFIRVSGLEPGGQGLAPERADGSRNSQRSWTSRGSPAT
eukprot:5643885-Pyramimonas_sp.AAC.1